MVLFRERAAHRYTKVFHRLTLAPFFGLFYEMSKYGVYTILRRCWWGEWWFFLSFFFAIAIECVSCEGVLWVVRQGGGGGGDGWCFMGDGGWMGMSWWSGVYEDGHVLNRGTWKRECESE